MNRKTRICRLLCVLGLIASLAGHAQGADQTAPASRPATVVDPATGMEFVFVKGGCFKMGDEKGPVEEKPAHEVCVSDFYMGKYEVKRGEFNKIIKGKTFDKEACSDNTNCPADGLSWLMVQEFIMALNDKGNTNYRLPTEAEWEYAARGGKQQVWAGTSSEKELAQYARHNGKLGPVGSLKPNSFGLYDMSGNVEEWCMDWYGEKYYASSPKNNPTGSFTGERRVMRGGSANDASVYVRSAARDNDLPENTDAGFRLVLPAR